MKKYDLIYGELTIDDEALNYIKWKEKFQKEFPKIFGEYKKLRLTKQNNTYLSDKDTIVYPVNNFLEDMQTLTRPLINTFIQEAREHEIYDLTADEFDDLYVKKHLKNQDFEGLTKLDEIINQVKNQLEINQEVREIQNASRGQVVGGGFGLKGAVKGMVTASVMNSMADSYAQKQMEKAKRSDNYDANKILGDLRYSEEGEQLFRDSVFDYVFSVFLAYEDLQAVFGIRMKSGFDNDKCYALLESAQAVPEKASDILYKAICADPTECNAYYCWVYMLGDKNGELEKAAKEIIGLDLSKFKNNLIERSFVTFNYDNVDNYSSYISELKEKGESYKCDTKKYIECLEEMISQKEQCLYYFGDEKFDSIEEAELYKKEYNKFYDHIKNVDFNSISDLNDLLSWINEELKTELKERYKNDVEEKLKLITAKACTVNGVEYGSLEEAEKVRKSYTILKSIAESTYETQADIDNAKVEIEKIEIVEAKEKANIIIQQIEDIYDIQSNWNDDYENTNNRVYHNQIIHDVRKIRKTGNELGISVKSFKDRHSQLFEAYRTIDNVDCFECEKADLKYFELIEKANKYVEYTASKSAQPEKKGFLSKISTGVKDALQKTNENAYNYLTENGTLPLPIISVQDREIMNFNNNDTEPNDCTAINEVKIAKEFDTSVEKVNIGAENYYIKQKEFSKQDIINLVKGCITSVRLNPDNKEDGKTKCYNSSLSEGTYMVVAENISEVENLDVEGLYIKDSEKVSKKMYSLVKDVSKSYAENLVKELKKNEIICDCWNMKYVIPNEIVYKCNLYNYDKDLTYCDGDIYVVIKKDHSVSDYEYTLERNYLALANKYNLYDDVTSCRDVYVKYGYFSSFDEAAECCKKFYGKGLLDSTEQLPSGVDVKILVDTKGVIRKEKSNINQGDIDSKYIKEVSGENINTTKKEGNDDSSVELTDVGPNKLDVIKITYQTLGISLDKAKELVDNVPTVVARNISFDLGIELICKYEDVGASASFCD